MSGTIKSCALCTHGKLEPSGLRVQITCTCPVPSWVTLARPRAIVSPGYAMARECQCFEMDVSQQQKGNEDGNEK